MSDTRNQDDEAGGSMSSFRAPVANGADAWGAPEPHVPPIPVDEAASDPGAWTPDVAPAPPVGDADPVWAVPVPPRAPEPEPMRQPDPEPVRQPDPVWAVPVAEPVREPEPQPVRQPDPVWAVPVVASAAEPEPDAPPPAVAPDPGRPSAMPAWQQPAASDPADPWGVAPVSAPVPGGAVASDAELASGAAPGPLTDRLAQASSQPPRPPQPAPDPIAATPPATAYDATVPPRSSVSTGTGSTAAAAAAGWPTAATAQPGIPQAQPAWPATPPPAVGAPPASSARTDGTVGPAGYAAAGYVAAQQPPAAAARPGPAPAPAAGWPAQGADPRAAAWPAEPRSPYAPPSAYGQGGYAQGPANQAAYGAAAGWPPGTYGQQAQPGQPGYGASGWSTQPGSSWGSQQPPAGQWNQNPWAGQPAPAQPPASQAAWAGYPNQGYDQSGQAAWGATNAAYWAAEEPTGPAGYGRSLGASLSGIVLLVFGLLAALGGGLLASIGASTNLDELMAQASPSVEVTDAMRDFWNLLVGFSLFLLAAGIIQALAGLLVLAHKTVGRVLGILYGLAGTLLGGLMTVVLLQVGPAIQNDGSRVDVSGSAIPFGVLAAIYLFVFLALAAGGKHFRRDVAG